MSSPQNSPSPLIVARNLAKSYPRGQQTVPALVDINLEIGRGEFVAIVGPSGSGKTTLLNLMGCMDVPTSGMLRVAGREVQKFTEAERTRFRRHEISFVFQHFGLIPTLNVVENVTLPLLFSRRTPQVDLDRLLERVGLQHRRDHKPSELSGGEMQRVAMARALVSQPSLLLADEPTGNLDTATGETLVELMKELHANGLTIVVVTHNPAVAAAAQRSMTMRDGRLA
jgi:putative ABC transport system ATP-binding protein